VHRGACIWRLAVAAARESHKLAEYRQPRKKGWQKSAGWQRFGGTGDGGKGDGGKGGGDGGKGGGAMAGSRPAQPQ